MEVAIIILAVFQLALLVKIWQMTNDVRVMKDKFIVVSMRDYPVERKIEIINDAAYNRLWSWHKVRKNKDSYKVSAKIEKAVKQDYKFFQTLIDEYCANEVYSVEKIKERMIDYFIIK